jgi:hypothetical protein
VTVLARARLLARLANARHGNEAADLRDLVESTYPLTSLVTRTSSFQTLTSGAETILTWQNEVIDELGIWDLGVSSTVATLQTDGVYCFDYRVLYATEATFLDNQTNFRQSRVVLNNTTSTRLAFMKVPATVDAVSSGSGVARLTAGTTIDFRTTQSSGENISLTEQTMTIVRLGGA